MLSEIDTAPSKRISDYGDKSIIVTEIMRKIQIFEGIVVFAVSLLSFQNQSFCWRMLIHFAA